MGFKENIMNGQTATKRIILEFQAIERIRIIEDLRDKNEQIQKENEELRQEIKELKRDVKPKYRENYEIME